MPLPANHYINLTLPDGTERLVEANYSFLTDAGKRTMMLSMIRDVTEQKQDQRSQGNDRHSHR